MQTFVPFIDWAECARVTDDHPVHPRSAKQRVEGYQVLNHLLGNAPKSYPHHPINDMWRGYEPALAIYTMQFCLYRYMERRLQDTIFFEVLAAMKDAGYVGGQFGYREPPWRRDELVMRSHRSNLYRKDSEHYKLFKQKGGDWPYLWPFCFEDGTYELRVSKADAKRIKDGERSLPANVKKEVVIP